MPIRKQIGKRQPFATDEEHVYIALRRAAWSMGSRMAPIYGRESLTASQYNVLRILRGHHPERLTASRIGEMMVSRDSDLTRILTHLQKRRLVSRKRCAKDRRRIWVEITGAGLTTLSRLDKPVSDAIQSALGGLGPAKLRAIAGLLEETCESIDSGA